MISVVIPCYNAEKQIARAIDSVLSQTYNNWELILVNNNSVDATEKVLQFYKQELGDKVIILNEAKKGAPAARNRGLYAAKGNWIQFLDSDDELLPDKLARQRKLIEQNDADILVGGFSRVIKLGRVVLRIPKKQCKDVWEGLLTARLGITSANLWKKEALITVSGWDENLTSSQEYEMMFRMLVNNAKLISDTDNISAYIHYEKNSITRNANKQRNIKILENHVNFSTKVQRYLKSKDLLTPRIERIVTNKIYYDFVDKSSQVPEYSKAKMQSLARNILFIDRVKIKIKVHIKNLIK